MLEVPDQTCAGGLIQKDAVGAQADGWRQAHGGEAKAPRGRLCKG